MGRAQAAQIHEMRESQSFFEGKKIPLLPTASEKFYNPRKFVTFALFFRLVLEGSMGNPMKAASARKRLFSLAGYGDEGFRCTCQCLLVLDRIVVGVGTEFPANVAGSM